MRELAAELQEGPRPMSWSEFRSLGPWGHPGQLEDTTGAFDHKVSSTRLAALGDSLGLSQLKGPNYLVVVPLALVAALVGLPRPLVCARECSWAWAVTEEAVSSLEVMKRSTLAEADWMAWAVGGWVDKVRPQVQHEAAGWEPGRLAVHVGELFRELVLAPAVAHNPFLPKRGVVDAGEGHSLGMAVSPRGRSSRSRARRATSLLDCAPATPTRVEPTVAVSPASRSGKRKAAADAEVDLQGLTPNSLLTEGGPAAAAQLARAC